MSAADQESGHPQGSADPSVEQTADAGAVGRLPRLRPFDFSALRDEPRPATVPPPVMVHDEPWRKTGVTPRLPSCGDMILGPIERPARHPAPASMGRPPAVVHRPRSRPLLWAAGLVAVLIAGAPILALQATSRHLGAAGELFEGRSSSAGGALARPTNDGVPIIRADPRPYKRAVLAGSEP